MSEQLRLSDLFINGSIVSLHTSIWRARTKLTAADLGIPDSEAVQQALSLGSHRLAPPESFQEINEVASAADRTVKYASLVFAMIPGARYVPHSKLPELVNRLKQYRSEFNASVDRFVEGYADMKDKMLPVIRKALVDAAQNADAAEEAYRRVQAEYPSSGEIREKFRIYWSVYTVQGSKNPYVEEAMREEAAEVGSIVRGMVEQVRGEFSTKLADLIEIVKKGGKLKERSLESAMTVIDRVESMNMVGDQTLTAQCEALRRMLQGFDTKSKEMPAGFEASLTGIQGELSKSLEDAVVAAEAALTGLGNRRFA